MFKEDLKRFWLYINKVKYILRVKDDISEGIDIFISEDVEYMVFECLMILRILFVFIFIIEF